MDDVLDDQLRYYRARAAIDDQTYERTGPYDRGREANLSWKKLRAVVGHRHVRHGALVGKLPRSVRSRRRRPTFSRTLVVMPISSGQFGYLTIGG